MENFEEKAAALMGWKNRTVRLSGGDRQDGTVLFWGIWFGFGSSPTSLLAPSLRRNRGHYTPKIGKSKFVLAKTREKIELSWIVRSKCPIVGNNPEKF